MRFEQEMQQIADVATCSLESCERFHAALAWASSEAMHDVEERAACLELQLAGVARAFTQLEDDASRARARVRVKQPRATLAEADDSVVLEQASRITTHLSSEADRQPPQDLVGMVASSEGEEAQKVAELEAAVAGIEQCWSALQLQIESEAASDAAQRSRVGELLYQMRSDVAAHGLHSSKLEVELEGAQAEHARVAAALKTAFKEREDAEAELKCAMEAENEAALVLGDVELSVSSLKSMLMEAACRCVASLFFHDLHRPDGRHRLSFKVSDVIARRASAYASLRSATS
eukprot:811816-Rhodomonas_salina.3